MWVYILKENEAVMELSFYCRKQKKIVGIN